MAKDSITTSRQVKGQSVTSDASSIDQALGYVGKTEGARRPKSLNLAQNNPATPKGYTKLGKAGFPTDGKPHATDNRGEGE